MRYRWHALAMGRSSALQVGDITCHFPDAQQTLTSLCEIARIAEANAEGMYLRKSESFQSLYSSANRTYAQLRQIAQKSGIGSSNLGGQGNQLLEVPSLVLHNGEPTQKSQGSFCKLIVPQCTITRSCSHFVRSS